MKGIGIIMENTKVPTKREFYEAIIETMKTGECKYAPEDVIKFCENEVALLDKKAVKAKERAAAKRAEADPLYDIVAGALTGEYQVIAEIAAKVAEADGDATVAKVTNRLTKLCNDGIAERTEVTIPATETSKSRKAKAFKRV